jgi:hypothetical protein
LVWNADDGLLLMSLVRACPEGLVCGICRSEKSRSALEQYSRTLEAVDKPQLAARGVEAAPGAFEIPPEAFAGVPFDRLFFRDMFVSPESIAQFRAGLAAADAAGRLAPDWKALLSQRIPIAGQRLSALIREQILQNREGKFASILQAMEGAESRFYADPGQPLFAWDAKTIADVLGGPQGTVAAQFSVTVESRVFYEKRRLAQADVHAWFNADKSPYGKAVREALGDDTEHIMGLLLEAAQNRLLFDWKTETAFVAVVGSFR